MLRRSDAQCADMTDKDILAEADKLEAVSVGGTSAGIVMLADF